jgi:hypothetical protein
MEISLPHFFEIIALVALATCACFFVTQGVEADEPAFRIPL